MCGAGADSFCARCGVTPYCSAHCQRRDWHGRHKAVCHNLARLSLEASPSGAVEAESLIPTAAPLRRPRSPQIDPGFSRKDDDNGSDKSFKNKFIPPGQLSKQSTRNMRGGRNALPRKPDNKNGHPEFRRPQIQNNEDWGAGRQRGRERQSYKHQRVHFADQCNDDKEENWDAKPEPKSEKKEELVKITPVPKTSPVKEVKSANQMPEKVSSPNKKTVANLINQNDSKIPAAKNVEVKASVTNQKPPGSTGDVTPAKKLVPKSCVIETLSVGDTVLLSVENSASECRASAGFVCLSLHERYEEDYQALCDSYGAVCEAEKQPYTPALGETFSYFDAADGAWYRARCVSAAHCALLDAARLAPLPAARAAPLPAAYALLHEFCALLQADVKVGDSFTCVLLEEIPGGFKVSLENIEGGSAGVGQLTRWLPLVDPPPSKTQGPPSIPQVIRPAVNNNSKVILVHVTSCEEAFVREASTEAIKNFDAALHDTALYGLKATPLKEPPLMGQYVVSKYTDGHHYRALVKRTNIKQNKYLLEYVEFGNSHINTLENLYPCPDTISLENKPAMTSRVAFSMTSQQPLTPEAEQYLDTIKDEAVELLLTIPSGVKTAPSGSEVILTVAQSKENVNRKVEQLITPEWAKLQESGGDVLDTEPVMYSALQYVELARVGDVTVLDFSALQGGTVSACPRDHPHMRHVLTTLTEQMGKYCESEIGSKPYLPKAEELCIAQLPPYPQWFRAVLAEQVAGAGGAEAELCYIDYGNMERVPVALIRKMLSGFVSDCPALANTIEIRDFPKNPTLEMLERAVDHLNINDEGHGVLRVVNCEKEGPGMYVADAPDLVAAMTKK